MRFCSKRQHSTLYHLSFMMPVMPISFLVWMAGLMVVYTVLAQAMKTIYIRINREWV